MSVFPSVCGGYGIRGDRGEAGPGIYFQGPWDPDEGYLAGDMITTDEGIFIAISAVTGTAPPDPPWRLLVLWSEITGPPGTPGPPGSTYTHVQLGGSMTWTVAHNLGHYPAITVIDPDGKVVYADIQHTNMNTAVITFPVPTAGMASCT